MNLSQPTESLCRYVERQATAWFPDGAAVDIPARWVTEALARLEVSFEAVTDQNFQRGGETFFNHLNSDQYAMFLYLLANTAWRAGGPRSVCDKLFFLNKSLYGIDVFYEVELPRIFHFAHAVGTVLGRATYSDYFLVYQHCTVGASRNEEGASRGSFPILGKHVSLYAGATVLGGCTLADGCKISAGSIVMNRNLKPNTLYRGVPHKWEAVTFPFPDNIWKK